MAPRWLDNATHTRLREDVTLLEMLNPEAGNPTEIPWPQNERQDDHLNPRQLSDWREIDLVSIFSFLSGASDDPLKVTAIAIEEDPTHGGLTIRLAMNTDDAEKTANGLNKIATVLEKIANKTPTHRTHDYMLREAIINLDRERILCRLRSKHANVNEYRKKARPLLVDRLKKAFDVASGLPHLTIPPTLDLKKIKSDINVLNNLNEQLEATSKLVVRGQKTEDLLWALCEGAHEFERHRGFGAWIDSIPNESFNPHSGSKLYLALAKLGRYFSACGYLSKAASRLPAVFKSVKICTVPVPARSPLHSVDASFQRSVSRIITSSNRDKSINRILSAHKITSRVGAQSRYAEKYNTARKNCKVHAEIQLIFFYETHPDILAPRIIGSSKSTCYLCNLFIQMHGRFHTCRTHGMLYGNWTLPCPTSTQLSQARARELSGVILSFLRSLEAEIRSLVRKESFARAHPNESSIFTTKLWTPSDLSLASSSGLQPMKSERLELMAFSAAVPLKADEESVEHELSASEPPGLIEDNGSSPRIGMDPLTPRLSNLPLRLPLDDESNVNSDGAAVRRDSSPLQADAIRTQSQLTLYRDSSTPTYDAQDVHSSSRPTTSERAISDQVQSPEFPDASPFEAVYSEVPSGQASMNGLPRMLSSAQLVPSTPPPAPRQREADLSSRPLSRAEPLPSRPLTRAEPLPSQSPYEPLPRGLTVTKMLSPAHPVIKVGTKRIHLSLSWDKILDASTGASAAASAAQGIQHKHENLSSSRSSPSISQSDPSSILNPAHSPEEIPPVLPQVDHCKVKIRYLSPFDDVLPRDTHSHDQHHDYNCRASTSTSIINTHKSPKPRPSMLDDTKAEIVDLDALPPDIDLDYLLHGSTPTPTSTSTSTSTSITNASRGMDTDADDSMSTRASTAIASRTRIESASVPRFQSTGKLNLRRKSDMISIEYFLSSTI
ncbi:MAG: hypothetical protein M1825_005612 [Sarcosagium campestre]|nr:MAG: hypothetical protein M1825_005612 [Sarcosagium campestre]